MLYKIHWNTWRYNILLEILVCGWLCLVLLTSENSSQKTRLVECGIFRMGEPIFAISTASLIFMSNWISSSSSVTYKIVSDSILSVIFQWSYLWTFLFLLIRSCIFYHQCVDQCVERIVPSLWFTECHCRWDLYFQQWYCHTSAHHL